MLGAAAFQQALLISPHISQALAETNAAKLAPADAGVPRELVPNPTFTLTPTLTLALSLTLALALTLTRSSRSS